MQRICILTINKDRYCVQNKVFAFLHAPIHHFIRPTSSTASQRKYLTSQSRDSDADLHGRRVTNSLFGPTIFSPVLGQCHRLGSNWRSRYEAPRHKLFPPSQTHSDVVTRSVAAQLHHLDVGGQPAVFNHDLNLAYMYIFNGSIGQNNG